MASGESPSRRDADAYLSSLSGDAAERVTAMKWARYLGAAFGTAGALSALRYYREINWISAGVQRTMVDYVRGLPIEELEGDGDASVSLDDSLDSLSETHFERHAKSLEFIAAIGGDSIEHGLASLKITDELGAGAMGPTAPGVSGPEVPFGEASGEGSSTPARRAAEVAGSTAPATGEESRASDGGSRAAGATDDHDDRSSPAGTDDGDASEAPTAADGSPETVGTTPDTDETPSSADDLSVDRADETPSTTASAGLGSDSGGDPGGDGGADAATGSPDGDGRERPTDEGEDDGDDGWCIALTDSGDRCSRPALEDSDYCHRHSPG